MTALLLHAFVLAGVLLPPAFARWADYHYDLSTRWSPRCPRS